MACRTIRQRSGHHFEWVTNSSQPDLKNLLRIAKTLNVDVARLLNLDVLNEEQQVNLQSATSDNMVLSENKEK